MFGRKRKEEEPAPNLQKFQKRLEILNKNIDIDKLIVGIEKFLTRSDDPFDFNTYTIHDIPEKKLKIFKIEYGMKSPTTDFLVVIEGDSNNLQILDYLPTYYVEYAAGFVISPVLFFPTIINSQLFYTKLWNHIINTLKSLESQNF